MTGILSQHMANLQIVAKIRDLPWRLQNEDVTGKVGQRCDDTGPVPAPILQDIFGEWPIEALWTAEKPQAFPRYPLQGCS
jgi:hypothetical protein